MTNSRASPRTNTSITITMVFQQHDVLLKLSNSTPTALSQCSNINSSNHGLHSHVLMKRNISKRWSSLLNHCRSNLSTWSPPVTSVWISLIMPIMSFFSVDTSPPPIIIIIIIIGRPLFMHVRTPAFSLLLLTALFTVPGPMRTVLSSIHALWPVTLMTRRNTSFLMLIKLFMSLRTASLPSGWWRDLFQG